MGIPFIIYYKDGKVVKATSSIQTRGEIFDKEYSATVIMDTANHYDAIVIGAGLTGLTAGKEFWL